MKTPLCNKFLLLLFCAAVWTSCATQPRAASNRNLKLETIQRPLGEAPTYLYREQPADR